MDELTLALVLDVVSKGSATAFLAVMFWLVATERFVPKGRLKDCQEERDREIADANAARERAEKRAKEAHADKMTIIADRDRLRSQLERRPR